MPVALPCGYIKDTDIPPGCRVAIYGAGGRGRYLRGLLRARGVETAFYLDSTACGEFDGLEKVAVAQLSGRLAEVDLVVIASVFWLDMEAALRALGVEAYAVWGAEGGGMLFAPEEVRARQAELDAVLALLDRERDRTLYSGLIRSRCAPDVRQAVRELRGLGELLRPTPMQYLDHVRPQVMRVVVEGGLFDGEDSLALLPLLPPQAKIYGFEPDRAAFAALRRPGLEEGPRLEVLPLALWSHSIRLAFKTGSPASSSVGEASGSGAAETVDAVSIDDFAAQRGLKVDFIKLDVEGAEQAVLAGAARTLERDRPQVAVSIYHAKADLTAIPLLLGRLPGYVHRVEHYSRTLYETMWYALPREVLLD